MTFPHRNVTVDSSVYIGTKKRESVSHAPSSGRPTPGFTVGPFRLFVCRKTSRHPDRFFGGWGMGVGGSLSSFSILPLKFSNVPCLQDADLHGRVGHTQRNDTPSSANTIGAADAAAVIQTTIRSRRHAARWRPTFWQREGRVVRQHHIMNAIAILFEGSR